MKHFLPILLAVIVLSVSACSEKQEPTSEKAKADSTAKASKSQDEGKLDVTDPQAQKEIIAFFDDMTAVIKSHTVKMQEAKSAKVAAECLIASSADMKAFDARVQGIQAKYKNVDKMDTSNIDVKTANRNLGDALSNYLKLVTEVSIKHQNDPIFKKALEQLQNDNKQ
ncbi:MAG: hypothetical protein JNL36_08830 [Candidatus Kapabacteria bacterium]|jgi:hypothetical protein|nr:hypothetical protein [Candidatus Kapabacteria bacterium]